ncbi:MAG TPA: hypothetical protein QGF08_04210 [Candidatus Marinimicrobia bacterium]|jgi:hypothetical protein|nr:hypothetical protein [Candidatus Neomarinimicrobiota bacterium]HJM70070.1 hypothetical protein [Candidatus Neomarinimicrobiota bacterium]|tara:strand:- start:4244 stop:4375 length:132 start_codon:yes stop_codon:yes gene_type:complete
MDYILLILNEIEQSENQKQVIDLNHDGLYDIFDVLLLTEIIIG